MGYKYRYTFQEIVAINGGDKDDAVKAIEIFSSHGLRRISNRDEDTYSSDSVQLRDLRMKTRTQRVLYWIKETDSVSGALIKWAGWLVFLSSWLYFYFF